MKKTGKAEKTKVKEKWTGFAEKQKAIFDAKKAAKKVNEQANVTTKAKEEYILLEYKTSMTASAKETAEILKWTKFYKKQIALFETKYPGKWELEFLKFSSKIDKVVWTFISSTLEWLWENKFPASIKASLTVWFQFSLMDSLAKTSEQDASNFFWSVNSKDIKNVKWSKTSSFANFGKTIYSLTSVFSKSTVFQKTAIKMQNFLSFLVDRQYEQTETAADGTVSTTKVFDQNSILLNNSYYIHQLLQNPERASQDKIDASKLSDIKVENITIDQKATWVIALWTTEEQKTKLKNIAEKSNAKISIKMLEKIESSLWAAEKFLKNRPAYQEMLKKPVGFLDTMFKTEIPMLGNLWSLLWFWNSVADLAAKHKDNKILNLVFKLIGIPNGVKWVVGNYYKEKLKDKLKDFNQKKALTKMLTSFVSIKKPTKTDSRLNKDISTDMKQNKIKNVIQKNIEQDKKTLKKSMSDTIDENTKFDISIIEDPKLGLETSSLKKIEPEKNSEGKVITPWYYKLSNWVNKTDFVSAYIDKIIPQVVANLDIKNKKLTQESTALAIFGTLLYGRDFMEWVNLWVMQPGRFIWKVTTNKTSEKEKEQNNNTETFNDKEVDSQNYYHYVRYLITKFESNGNPGNINYNDANKWPSIGLIQRNGASGRARELMSHIKEKIWVVQFTAIMWQDFVDTAMSATTANDAGAMNIWKTPRPHMTVDWKIVPTWISSKFKELMKLPAAKEAMEEQMEIDFKEKYLPIIKRAWVTDPKAIVYCMSLVNIWTSTAYLQKYLTNWTTLEKIHKTNMRITTDNNRKQWHKKMYDNISNMEFEQTLTIDQL